MTSDSLATGVSYEHI